MIDGEIPDTDPSSDALTAEEAAAFEEMRSDTGKPEPHAEAEKPAEPEKPTEEKEPEVQKLVPHGAFEEERQRRKAAQQEAQREREERARIQGQLDALRQPRSPKSAAAGAELDQQLKEQLAEWEKDPEKHPIEALKGLIADRKARDDAAQKEQEERQDFQRISAIGSRHAERFAKTQPNFFDTKDAEGKPVQGAYSFMRQKAAEKIQSQYPSANQQQVIDAVDAVERQHIQDCLQSGDNAAERLWELAQEAGYKAPEPPKATLLRGDDGKFQKSEAERIADLEKAQRASRSLGNVPAGGGESELSMSALADMDDAEFAAATKDGNWEKLHRRGVI